MNYPKADRFFIETWGCQMNELDSQRLSGQLMQDGLLPTATPRDADVILLNSCSVREKAAQKAYSRLGQYRLLKSDRPDLLIGFCGCVAQQEGERALRRVPELDFVLGTGRVGEMRSVMAKARKGMRPVAVGFPEDRPYEIDAISRDGLYKGMVTVVEGCDKNCTFCIVPQTRGPERSRPLAAIVNEVRHLVDFGFLEIELLGQTVNHWRGTDADGGQIDFADLLEAVANVPGLRRLRFVTSYPRDFSPRMVDQVGSQEVICPYIHLPVQSGSNSVLRRMGRGYTVGEYRDLVTSLRAARSGIALSTDIIVGFPGETEDEFEGTLRLVEELRFASLYAFKYSPRPGTAALRIGEPIDLATSDRRLQQIFATQKEIQLELNQSLVGRELEILVTGPGKTPGTVVGRSACHRVVHLDANAGLGVASGEMCQARVDRAFPHSLSATVEARAPLARVDEARRPLVRLGEGG